MTLLFSAERVKPLLIGELFSTALRRPWVFLFKELISVSLAVYLAIVYGTLYMLFASFPIVYDQNRGWSVGVGGLAFLGLLAGTTMGSMYYIFCKYLWFSKGVDANSCLIIDDNPRYVSLLREHRVNNPYTPLPPEARLPPAMLGAVLLPLGLFWFAWTCQKSVHWIVSILANIPFGAGMVMIFLSLFVSSNLSLPYQLWEWGWCFKRPILQMSMVYMLLRLSQQIQCWEACLEWRSRKLLLAVHWLLSLRSDCLPDASLFTSSMYHGLGVVSCTLRW